MYFYILSACGSCSYIKWPLAIWDLGDLNTKHQLASMKTNNSIPLCCSAAFYTEGKGEQQVLLALRILRNFFSWIPKVSLLSFTLQGHIQWEKAWQNLLWFKPKIGFQFFSTVPYWLKLRALWKNSILWLYAISYNTTCKTYRAMMFLCKYLVIWNYYSPVCKCVSYY